MALLDRVFFGKRLHPSATLGLVVGFVGLAFLFDPFGEGASTGSAPSSASSPPSPGPPALCTHAERPLRSGRSSRPGSPPSAAVRSSSSPARGR
jgi:hypothetical protein